MLTCGDGGAHGGEDEEEGGDELGEIGAEGGRRKALLEVSSEVRSHFIRRSTLAEVEMDGRVEAKKREKGSLQK